MVNLNLPQMTAGQSNKNVTSNDGDAALDKAITEHEILDFTAGDITLTTAQFRENFLLECNNVVAARVLNLPTSNTIKRFFSVSVQDDETFNVTVTNGTGESIVIPGGTKVFYTDGTVNDLRDITAAGGGGGAFIDLSDVDPSAYTSQEGKLVRVNAVPDGLEFVSPSASGGGNAGQAVNGFRARTVGFHNSGVGFADDTIILEASGGVFDDGAAFQATGPLTLDFATTGLNGLDTGSPTANQWYELYIIQRSDTEAIGCIANLGRITARDEFQSTDAADLILLKADSSTDKIAQGFQPTRTEKLLYIDVWMENITTSPAVGSAIWMTIEADSAGDPDGTPLATSYRLEASRIGDVTKPIRFIFPIPPSLTAATQYHMVLEGDWAVSDTVGIQIAGNTSSTYANGVSKDFDGVSTWTASTDILDWKFETWGDNGGGIANLTFPTNYDRAVLVGYFRTDTSSDMEPYHQLGRRVEYYGDFGIASTSLATTVLTDLRSCLPPVPVWFRFTYEASSATPLQLFGGLPHGHGLDGAGTIPFHQDYEGDVAATVFQARSKDVIDLYTETMAIYQRLGSAVGNCTVRPIGYTF